MKRKLTAEEAALWQRVVASVTPLTPKRVAPVPAPPPEWERLGTGSDGAATSMTLPQRAVVRAARHAPAKKEPSGDTLDGSWDRRLSRGLVSPESSIDLHGHTLASAYDRLDRGLAHALQRGDRVLLLITGKPPRPESEHPHPRGAIRAAIRDWLGSSRHADRIAAVRGAHPRHGGSGALYIVLRRPKLASTRKN